MDCFNMRTEKDVEEISDKIAEMIDDSFNPLQRVAIFSKLLTQSVLYASDHKIKNIILVIDEDGTINVHTNIEVVVSH